jgi:hypothetical protein
MERFISDNTTLDQENVIRSTFYYDDKQTVAQYVDSMVTFLLLDLNVPH